MDGEIITYKNYSEIYEWLSYNVITHTDNENSFTLTSEGKINAYCDVSFYVNVPEIIYPFGYVGGNFDCSFCYRLTSLINSPKKVGCGFDCQDCRLITSLIGSPESVGGDFSCNGCKSLTSIIGFPKHIKGSIRFFNTPFSNKHSEKQKYNLYIDMWLKLSECITEDEMLLYVNNYKDKYDAYYGLYILPKEVINQYKIDFLLK